MQKLMFAGNLEESIIDGLSNLLTHCPAELCEGIEQCKIAHNELRLVLNHAENELAKGGIPALEPSKLVGSEATWQVVNKNYGKQYKGNTANLTMLWQIAAMLEKSAQYYQQASANSALPNERLFFSSIVEIKKTLRRRLDGLISIASNKVWEEIGFSPSVFGRE